MKFFSEIGTLEDLQAIIDSVPLGILVWDESFKLIAYNQMIIELLGLEGVDELNCEEAFLKASMVTQTCGTASQLKMHEVLAELEREGTVTTEWLHRKADGVIIPTEVTINYATFKGQRVRISYTRALDVKKDKSVQELSRYLQALYNSNFVGIAIWDNDLRIIDCNSKLLHMLEVNSKKELAQPFHRFSPERQPCGRLSSELAREYNDKVYVDGIADFDWTHITTTGKTISTRVRSERIYYEGEIVALCIVRDRTKEVALEREAALATKRMRFMFDNSPIGISMWGDNCTKLLDSNVALWSNLGFKSKEDYAQNFAKSSPLLQPCGTPSVVKRQTFNSIASKYDYFRAEWMYNTVEGDEFPTELVLKNMNFDGEDVTLAFARDLREEKNMLKAIAKKQDELLEALADLEKANTAKDYFLANMSHELRTPLNSILGISQICLQKEQSDFMQNNLQKIKNSGLSLLNSINNVIDMTDMEAGNLAFDNNPFSLEKVLDRAQAELVELAAHKSLQIKFDVDPSILKYYVGDGLRIGQVLRSLCNNAVQYTNEGHINVNIGLKSKNNRIYTILMQVEDSGIGIKKEDFERIFLPFEQVSLGYARISEGAGLGLALCKNIVEHMGGSIDVKSELNKGTTFFVQLDLEEVEYCEENTIFAKTTNFKTLCDGQDLDVLLVDDNTINLEIGKAILEEMGLDVYIANNGQEAVDMCKNQDFKIVFMDIQMPVMDGLEATKRIRKLAGYAKGERPIVALTAHAAQAHKDLSLKAGMDTHLIKPIDIATLRDCVAKCLDSLVRLSA